MCLRGVRSFDGYLIRKRTACHMTGGVDASGYGKFAVLVSADAALTLSSSRSAANSSTASSQCRHPDGRRTCPEILRRRPGDA